MNVPLSIVNVPLSIVIVIATALLGIVGSLIILNLRSIKGCISSFAQRADKHDKLIERSQEKLSGVGEDFAKCKVDCERNFVSSELFLRETGYTRRSMQSLTESVNRMEGKLTVVEKLPQICGDISREIVKEMKNGGHNG